MSDNSIIGPGAVTDKVRSVEKTVGVKTQVVQLDLGAGTAEALASGSIPVSGTFYQATQPVSIASMPTTPVTFTWAGLTDTQLRASAVPVSFTWSGLTDTQLRASPVPVSGTFWQTTQPISAASLPLPSGAAQDGTDATGVTMPTGGAGIRGWLSSIYNKLNTSVAVTGTFWQATQPVSGSVSVSNFPASQAVTGTFWQTTQPVSIASMPTTPVTGTFWQATQPVSLATGVAQGTAAALSGAWPAKLTDGTTAVKVTVGNAQPVSTDGALLVNAIDTFAGTAQASGSRAVGTVNYDIVNYNGKGIKVWQDLTVLGASSVCTFSIQEKDPVSGKFITILSSAATGAGINATGTAKLVVYPGLTAVANSVGSDVLPVNIRIVSTVATAASTFSIGYSIIP